MIIAISALAVLAAATIYSVLHTAGQIHHRPFAFGDAIRWPAHDRWHKSMS